MRYRTGGPFGLQATAACGLRIHVTLCGALQAPTRRDFETSPKFKLALVQLWLRDTQPFSSTDQRGGEFRKRLRTSPAA
jgi:hypothetical protein